MKRMGVVTARKMHIFNHTFLVLVFCVGFFFSEDWFNFNSIYEAAVF